MDHFAGLDVLVKETSICIVDDTGKIVREVKVASEPETVKSLFHSGEVAITREPPRACGNLASARAAPPPPKSIAFWRADSPRKFCSALREPYLPLANSFFRTASATIS